MPRPKGSKNKRKLGIPEDLKAKLNGDDPLEVLHSIWGMDHDLLKRMMRSAAGRAALAMKLKAAESALPYYHSKLPVKLDVDQDQLPVIIIHRDRHQMQNAKQNQQLINSQAGAVARLAVAPDAQTIEVKGETDDEADHGK